VRRCGVDEGNETTVAEADVDERGLVGVVEREYGAGKQHGGRERLEQYAAPRVIEREPAFREKGETEHAVDFDRRGGQRVLRNREEHGHIVEACVTEFEAADVAKGNSTTSPVADLRGRAGTGGRAAGGRICVSRGRVTSVTDEPVSIKNDPP